jgi:NAD(P)-dependent dehydrogenase (short-subunit alcohol dehydrogenase family)
MLDLCETTDHAKVFKKNIYDLPIDDIQSKNTLDEKILCVSLSDNKYSILDITKKSVSYKEFVTSNDVQSNYSCIVLFTNGVNAKILQCTNNSEYYEYTQRAFEVIKKINLLIKQNVNLKIIFLSEENADLSSIFNAVAKCWKSENVQLWIKAITIDNYSDSNLNEIITHELSYKNTLTLQDTIEYNNNKRVRSELITIEQKSSQLCLQSKDVVFITGGARGIVPHMVYELCAQIPNLTIILTGRTNLEFSTKSKNRNKSNYDELQQNIIKLNKICNLEYIVCDISNYNELVKVVNNTVHKHNKISAFIHAAGISIDKTVEELTYSDWRAVLDTKIVPLLVLNDTLNINNLSAVVNISSAAALFGNIRQSAYSAANSVLESYTKSISSRCIAKSLAFSAIEGGMVSDGLRAVMKSLELTCLSPNSISSCLVNCLNDENNGETIEYMSNDKMFIDQIEVEKKERSLLTVFKDSKIVITGHNKAVSIPISITESEYIRFEGHRFFNKIVVPASFVINKIMDISKILYPDIKNIKISEYKALEMIVIEDNLKTNTILRCIIELDEERANIKVLLDGAVKAKAIVVGVDNYQHKKCGMYDEETILEPYTKACYGLDKIDLGDEYQIIDKVTHLDSLSVSLTASSGVKGFKSCEAALECITQSNSLYTTKFYDYPSFPYQIHNLVISNNIESKQFKVDSCINNYPVSEPLCSTAASVSDASGNQIISCEKWVNVFNQFINIQTHENMIVGNANINELKMKGDLSKDAGLDPCHYYNDHNIVIDCHETLKIAMALMLAKLGIKHKIDLEFKNNMLCGVSEYGFTKTIIVNDLVFVFHLNQDFEIVQPTNQQLDSVNIAIDSKIPILYGYQYVENLMKASMELMRNNFDELKTINCLSDWVELIGSKTNFKAKLFDDLLLAY